MGVKKRLAELEEIVGVSVEGPCNTYSSGLIADLEYAERRLDDLARELSGEVKAIAGDAFEMRNMIQDLFALLGVEYEFVPAQNKLVRTAAPDTLVPLDDLGKKRVVKKSTTKK